MHADALVTFGHGRQQRGNPQLFLLAQNVQRHGAIFAATPTKQYRLTLLRHFFRRRGACRPHPLVFPAESVLHPDQHFAAKRWIAERVLVRLVEEIRRPRIRRHASAELVMDRGIESRVARIIGNCRIDEVGVCTDTAKISAERPVQSVVSGTQKYRARVDRPAEQVIPRHLRGIKEGVLRFKNSRIVEGIASADKDSVAEARLSGKIHAAGSRQIRVEEAAAKTRVRLRKVAKADDVVKPIIEVVRREFDAAVVELLFETYIPGFAGFRFQRWITGKAWIGAKRLVKTRLLDAFAIKCTQPGFSPKAAALQKSERGADARHYASAEISVRFGSCAKVQSGARMRRIMEIEKASLVVAPQMTGLGVQAGAVVLVPYCKKKIAELLGGDGG